MYEKADCYCHSWRSVQLLADLFWKRWIKEYLPILQQRQKWLVCERNISVGDIVLMTDDITKRGIWPKAILIEVFPDADNVVSRVRVRTSSSTFLRAVRSCVCWKRLINSVMFLVHGWFNVCTYCSPMPAIFS